VYSASVVTGVLFLLSTIFAPLVAIIPNEAAVPALIIVGFLMMQQVKNISWDDVDIALPAFLTIVLMPFTYSITVGIGAGMVLFGAGFGVIENATFALLIEQLSEAKASALWNLAYDAGYGAGPAVFGLICASTGYPAAFALTGVLILATLPAALRERKAAVPALAGQLPRRLDV